MNKDNFAFDLIAQEQQARAGIFHTPHGDIPTPIFAPVGTQATVKAVTPQQLEELGASLVLSNTYHLFLRPGADLVAEMGGLHTFMNWPHPILTDSGGYQVFSLASTRKIDDDGVTFKSHIDGSTQRLTPEKSIEVQEKLGADIIMSLDECAPPFDRQYNEIAMNRTHAWAERCYQAKTRPDQALFGIVQGGIFQDLRENSAQFISAIDFPGYAIGGLSVGETKQETNAVLEWIDPILPQSKPRYLMGVGSPEDIINGILRGIDIFDCVLPTRLARHQAAMTFRGRINLLNAVHTHNSRPIDENCQCYTCRNFSRAYLRYLIVAKEMLAATLVSIHNINTLLELVRQARQAILEQHFQSYANDFLESWHDNQKSPSQRI
ncbi:MAG TPA: tRNA guanosine(34) transglycosylase Tgt [Anaerolineaceae bacterium]|nr:tRNA guanosine(34) transglycosylase Tgt [Anaerolineaceae bacterium]